MSFFLQVQACCKGLVLHITSHNNCMHYVVLYV